MTNLLTRTGARWWFRSRHSGSLNLFSYWLCALILAALAALIADALYQTWADRQAWHRQAAEYSDWIYAAPPDALKNYAGRFEKNRNKLIYGVTRQAEPLIGGGNPLVSAREGKALTKRCGKPGGMFGQSDTPVYPSCVTYAPRAKRGRLTRDETTVFNNFAAYITGLYANTKKVPETHRIERELAGAFGFTENNPPVTQRDDAATPSTPEPSEIKPNSPTFDVPWVYVASDTGAIAVFPGTTVIVADEWDTTSRPWFRGAMETEFNLTSDGLFENDILSVTYLDVLAKSPMLVRTYMHRFKVGEQAFVVAVDLKLRSEDVAGVTPVFFNRKPNSPRFFLQALRPAGLHSTHYAVFGLSALFFLLARRATAARKSRFTFRRTLARYGKIRIDEAFRLQKEEQLTKERKFGIEMQKYVHGKSETGETEAYGVASSTTIQSTGGILRGFELWEVSLNTDAHWKLLWTPFESVKSVFVGTISLAYTNEVLPDARWVLFHSEAFSMHEEAALYDSLPTLLGHNANRFPLRRDADPSADYFDIPYPLKEVSLFLSPPQLPDWLPVVVDPKELLAARQGRAYVKLSSAQIEELYSKSSVKAVMTAGYFELLLNNGQVDFLLRGSSIARLVSFSKPEAALDLTEAGRAKLEELQDGYAYAPPNSRSLKRVNAPIGNEGTRLPVYDFVILNESSVIVAYSIAQATGIDNVSGKQTKSTHYVEGYVSWRPPDVEFYRKHFDELDSGASYDLDARAGRVEAG